MLISKHPKESLFFSELKTIWNELATVYNTSFKMITYGKFPENKDILQSMQKIKDRITNINWKIEL